MSQEGAMETRLTLQALAEGLVDVLERVRCQGERFLIERDGETVAVLAAVAPPAGITLRELAICLGSLTLPGEGFAEDLEAIQACQPKAPAPTWPS
jgi:antitoxin (DNA-binding transcriptional repressor) of toxin-antitoxin stability system